MSNSSVNEIPKEFQISPINCDSYLVNGLLKKWKGNTTDVFSSIQTLNKDGQLKPTLLGSIPDMETESALEALKAADDASRAVLYMHCKAIFVASTILAMVVVLVSCRPCPLARHPSKRTWPVSRVQLVPARPCWPSYVLRWSRR